MYAKLIYLHEIENTITIKNKKERDIVEFMVLIYSFGQ
jgi:hypothetical protein